MVTHHITADCGNSPKKAFLKDWNIAFVEGNTDLIMANVTDDVTWHLVGDWQIEGKDDFLKGLEALKQTKQASEMTLESVITHGREASASGEVTLKDGKTYAFCHVYAFRSAKANDIKAVTSFIVAIK